jgi:hypothetical protein
MDRSTNLKSNYSNRLNQYRTPGITISSGYAGERNVNVFPYFNNKAKDDFLGERNKFENKFVRPNVYTYGEKIKINPDELKELKKTSKPSYNPNLSDIHPYVKKTIINIDSRFRVTQPENIYTEQIFNLQPYPIKFTNNSSLITITQPGHNFAVNDNISLTNVVGKNVNLKNPLMVKKNSLYMRIFHNNHGLSLYGTYDPTNANSFQSIDFVHILPPNFVETDNIHDGINQYYILKKNLTVIDMFIDLSNIIGNDSTMSFIGNIPINFLNKKHLAILLFKKNGIFYELQTDSYLIQLDKKSSINYQDGISYVKDKNGNPTSELAENNVNIRFRTLYGIPTNYLNGDFPISLNNRYGYFTIIDTTQNDYTIDVGFNAIIDPNFSYYNLSESIDPYLTENVILNNYGGGTNCLVKPLLNIDPGYPNPNNYVIKLVHNFVNVVEVKLISTEFPNSQRVINSVPISKNNRIYWQNLNDGRPIYFIEVTPGNYSPSALIQELQLQFSRIIKYKYTNESLTGLYDDSIVLTETPIDPQIYDADGYNKYHIITVNIDVSTDIVQFTSFNEIIQQDQKLPDGTVQRVLNIPDNIIQFQQQIGITTNNISIPGFIPLDLSTDTLFVYFTANTPDVSVTGTFPYAYGNLYVFDSLVSTTQFFINYRVRLEADRALLVNFFKYGKSPNITPGTHELRSININTLLENFIYTPTNNLVFLADHGLKNGDLIITDQFNDPNLFINAIYIFEVVDVLNFNEFKVIRYDIGQKYKFIYDDLLINFNASDAPVPSNSNQNYMVQVTLTRIMGVIILPENKNIMIVMQPNHDLNVGDTIRIENSASVNLVPSVAINNTFTIIKIIDNNHYQVAINKYTPLTTPVSPIQSNLISIFFPNLFRMLFNYQDTLGNILNFSKVGQSNAITPFKYIINNYDPYDDDYDYNALGDEYIQPLKKLSMTGDNYFYISSPELSLYDNTVPVKDVFAKIRWTDTPGSVVIDSFVPVTKIFEVPTSFDKLTFTMYNPDNTLVEFNGLDHSFTLEITESSTNPPDININERNDSIILIN